MLLCLAALGTESWAISWESDLADSLERAKTTGRPVMADFYTDWCGWCKKLDAEVYEDALVNKLADKFICVKVNCTKDNSIFTKYALQGYPTIIFFNPSGDIAETVVGYRKAPAFVDTMNKVLSNMSPGKTASPDLARDQPISDPLIKKERKEGEFVLTGIMGSKAIVNGKVVSIDSDIDGAKVVRISPDHVKLQYKDQELTLDIQS